MKTLLTFIISGLAILFFASCDGRKNANDALKKSVETFKKENTLESVSYFPESYTETVTDTITNNGYTLKIKHFSDMNSNVLNSFKVDSINYKHYYREFTANIQLQKNKSSIFNSSIDKALFLKYDAQNRDFLKDAIMRHLWLDESNATLNNELVINVLFCLPETDDCRFYELHINNDGSYNIKLTDRVYYTEE